ncbi:MAG: MEKHLA domain-containing protein, partial [Pirellulaceae bacterium]
MSLDPSQIPSGDFWAEVLLASFRRRTGFSLFDSSQSTATLASQLWESPWVVVAHGNEPDPLFHYGNRAALDLWEMPAEEFLGMPSRLTAEPVHREERERVLASTRRDGFGDDYSGIR